MSAKSSRAPLGAGGCRPLVSLAGALRRRYPAAHIAWAVEERTADVIRHNPHLDEVIVWERAQWKRMLRTGRWGAFLGAAVDFFTDLRDRRFDVAIDAQGLLRSGALAFFSGAPVRIGLGSREGSGLLMTKVVKREFFTRRIASADASFAQALGLDTTSFAMEIPRGADELAAVDRIVDEEGLRDGFVAACPFTTRFYKHWFEDRWSGAHSADPGACGAGGGAAGGSRGPGRRRPDSGGWRERSGGGCSTGGPGGQDHAGRGVGGGLPVQGAGRRGHRSESHGAAFGRPTVLIFGSNAPYLDPPTPGARILHSGRDCSPCWGKLTCDGRIDCMDDISVAEVLAAVEAAVA